MTNNYCVIMAGGIGSRFWPASTEQMPKQFLDILGTGKSLLLQTVNRFIPIVGIENILVLTNEMYKDLVLEQVPEFSEEQVVCEPARRNTAPCILYAAIKIWKKNAAANFIVAPSDHIITKTNEFSNAITNGLSFLEKQQESCVTLGIQPNFPSTGFGYIKRGHQVESDLFEVEQFTEKPELAKAKDMIATGQYYWNSGLFMWNAAHLVELFSKLQPKMFKLFEDNLSTINTNKEIEALKEYYPQCEDISVDYAILEKDKNVFVIPGNFGWSDLGSWSSLKDHAKKDLSNNMIIGSETVLFGNCSDNITVIPKNKKAIIQGLKNYIIVDTKDALLICPIEKEQEIKAFVKKLNSRA